MTTATTTAANHTLRHLLSRDTPCFIGRIAGIELSVAYRIREHPSDLTENDLAELENNAGIHVTGQESLQEYATRLIQSYEACTVIGEWERAGPVYSITGKGQEYIAQRTPHLPKIPATALEPYYVPPADSWIHALAGKRILVVHPFVRTLERQVPQLPHLFPGYEWLQGCTFQFVKPPMTLAGNHQNRDWREHMAECQATLRACQPFDVALVAAGGYGMLLSHFIYHELHASVVYVGGALQLFFGVIGKRWFSHPAIMAHVTDLWVRPEKADQPENYKRVEKGCYW